MSQRFRIPASECLAAALIILSLLPNVYGSSSKTPNRPILLTDQIEVQFETDVDVDKIDRAPNKLSLNIFTLDQALQKHQIQQGSRMFPWRKGKKAMVGSDDMSRFFVMSLPKHSDVYAIIDDLKKNPYIRSASPIWAMPVYEVTPDDPSLGSQWGLNAVGAKDAWEMETGSDTAIIAIIDVGVLYTHDDLKNNIWVNPGEDRDGDQVVFDLGDVDGQDNDGNGLADDLIGYDFFTGVSGDLWPGEDGSVPDYDPKDFNGHGTHCAGIAAAVTNNALYGAGLAGGWGGGNGPYRGARIMCIRVGGSYIHPVYPGVETGFVNTANCAQGVDYAATMGASVINCSWGFANPSSAMADAAFICNQLGIVMVHAAGNDTLYSTNGEYLDNLILGDPPIEVALSVAATSPGGYRTTFSNYGEYIDICAPGINILSTYSNHYAMTDAWLQGTSMAAPFVAGLAALIKSHMPQYTKVEINSLIMDNAVNVDGINPGYEGYLGAGLMDANATLASLPSAAFEAGPVLVGPAPLAVDFTDLSPNYPTSWEWDFGDGGSSFSQDPSHTYEDFGMHTVSLTIDEPRGTVTEVLKNLVMVTADTIKFDSIRIQTSATDQKVVMPIYLHNKFQNKIISISFQIKKDGETVGYHTIKLDSISIVGTRAEYFDSKTIPVFDYIHSRYKVNMLSNIGDGSEYLMPGEGAILNLHLDVDYTVPDGTVFTFDSLTIDLAPLRLLSIYGYYYPEFEAGKILVKDDMCGDVNKDFNINILDAIYLLNYKYKEGPPPEPESLGDVNLDGSVNILDIVYLIEYKYKGGPEPCHPTN